MNNAIKISVYVLLFVCVEILLFFFVDKPLSLYMRGVDIQAPWLVDIFRAYTDFGKSEWYLWPSGLGAFMCFVALRFRQLTPSLQQKIHLLGKKFLFFFMCVAASGIVADILKPMIGRARPFILQQQGFYGMHPFSFHAVWNSMPSGHATTAFTLALTLTLFVPRGRIIWWSIGWTLAISRIVVNAHYLSDILAGAFVAIMTVNALRYLFQIDLTKSICNNIFSAHRKMVTN